VARPHARHRGQWPWPVGIKLGFAASKSGRAQGPADARRPLKRFLIDSFALRQPPMPSRDLRCSQSVNTTWPTAHVPYLCLACCVNVETGEAMKPHLFVPRMQPSAQNGPTARSFSSSCAPNRSLRAQQLGDVVTRGTRYTNALPYSAKARDCIHH
jgi:hypothetical protein